MKDEEKTLSYKELAEIDQLYSKANSIQDEARRQLQSYSFDLAVRRSQGAVELYIKTIFRLIGKGHPNLQESTGHLSETNWLISWTRVLNSSGAALHEGAGQDFWAMGMRCRGGTVTSSGAMRRGVAT